MAERLRFSLVSPQRLLYEGMVERVDAPGSEGAFGVLAGHAPFMTTLAEGRIHVLDGPDEVVYEIQGGFADVTPEGLTILAESAQEVTN